MGRAHLTQVFELLVGKTTDLTALFREPVGIECQLISNIRALSGQQERAEKQPMPTRLYFLGFKWAFINFELLVLESDESLVPTKAVVLAV
jgi:hypothetical protein